MAQGFYVFNDTQNEVVVTVDTPGGGFQYLLPELQVGSSLYVDWQALGALKLWINDNIQETSSPQILVGDIVAAGGSYFSASSMFNGQITAVPEPSTGDFFFTGAINPFADISLLAIPLAVAVLVFLRFRKLIFKAK